MPLQRTDFFDFIFNSGRGLKKDQVDWSTDDATADSYVRSLAGSGGVLPDGSAVRDSLRWDDAASAWESFSSVDSWYYALTPNTDVQPIADVLVDGLTNGFNRSLRNGAYELHYDAAIGEAVLNRGNLPQYVIDGVGATSWEQQGTTESLHAVSVFSIPEFYHWIILPEDTVGRYILNRFWTIVPITDGRNRPPGVIDSGAYSVINQVLLINGVTHLVARARIVWEANTVNHNWVLQFDALADAPTAVWQTP